MTFVRFGTALVATFLAHGAFAQETWVQIEAQPNLRAAEDRARAYANVFPEVQGFAMNTGWYAIALGPFQSPAEAERQLRLLLGERMIPGDSYLADGGRFRQQFWPAGGMPAVVPEAPAGAVVPGLPVPVAAPPATEVPPTETPLTEAPATEAPVAAAPALPQSTLPDETVAEATASEARLSDAERRGLQSALRWAGFYSAAIDGAFGRGTRASMGSWQAAQGYEATGVLTTAQRAALVGAHEAALAATGIAEVKDEEAGITIDLPLGLVAFKAYEPPFVRYDAKGDSGVSALLISQQGNQAALYNLYDAVAKLALMPAGVEGSRSASGFSFEGRDGSRAVRAEVGLQGGLIKGWLLSWPVAKDPEMGLALAAMRDSFAAVGAHALDAGAGVPSEVAGGTLLAGLTPKAPLRAQSGLFIDAKGTVLTTVEAVEACQKLTVDAGTEARVAATAPALGLALVSPVIPLAPPATAEFAGAAPRVGAEAAVAGYAWAESLDAPVMTFGRVVATEGLAGEVDLARLELAALPGDVGGPVVDATGAVTGLLLPRGREDGKVLPENVSFALKASAIEDFLTTNGHTPVRSAATGAMAAEDLTAHALKMTTRVACWE